MHAGNKTAVSRYREGKQGLADKLISASDSLRYFLTEPVLLGLARMRYGRLYAQLPEDPLVTAYIPTYNRGRILIERSVPSVLAQTYKNFELLVIGDHCTDGTEELLQKIGDPRIRFYNFPDRLRRYPDDVFLHWLAGPVTASNKALELARGKWIARVDDDDIWTPDHLEELLRFAQRGGYEFVSSDYIEERSGVRRVVAGVGAKDPYYTRKDKPGSGYNPKIGGTSTWLYRSYLRLFKYNINCWRKKWNRVNDIDLSLRIFSAGVRMGFLEKALAYVLPRPGETAIGAQAYSTMAVAEHMRF
jgi:glycosyltransferase involved in cell wall biosynthesis